MLARSKLSPRDARVNPQLREDDLVPVVAARAVPMPGGRYRWLAIDCPYCGRTHRHGGGAAPGQGDGYRLAHCVRNDATIRRASARGYLLREIRAIPDEPSEASA